MAATLSLSATEIIENPAAGTVIGVLTVTGGANGEKFDNFTITGNMDERFAIVMNPKTGQYELVVKTGGDLFDFETPDLSKFAISIGVTGSRNTEIDPVDFTIAVTDNTAPTDIVLPTMSIIENAAVNAIVGTLEAVDPDKGDTFTFTLKADASGAFDIKDSRLIVKDPLKLDHEKAASYKIEVEVKDAEGNSFTKTLTIGVTDAVETTMGTLKNDWLLGTSGADIINGGAGNDKIFGLDGDDTINGGVGKDMLYGGAGKDTFVFDTPIKKGHFDHVIDFNSSDDTFQFNLSALKAFKVKGPKKSDLISKKGADDHHGKPDDKGGHKSVGFDKIFKKGKLEKKFFDVGTKANDKPDGSNDYIFYNKKNGMVYLDVDGSGSGKGIEILKVKPGTALTADDFLFI
jgi:serralysin